MSTLVFPSHVRERILEQHARLRTLLYGALEHAKRGACNDQELDPARLRTVVVELCDEFRAHLAFESEALSPVFAVLDSWGPERIRELDTEHARQRRQLDVLRARLESEETVHHLSAAIIELADDLLKDMDAEEDGCLRASLLSAVCLTVERR
ncbi:MAG: hemerythrin domain-containing protein [Pseudomonadota bacterium]